MKVLLFAFALALLALLALPATALAKGRTSVTMCGPDGCRGLGDAQQLGGYPDGGPTGEIPPPAPYYELRFTSRGHGEEHTWATWYVPSAKLLASVDERAGVYWMPMDDPKLAGTAARVRPFPTPEITAVTIGDRRVTDNPASFLRVLTVETTDSNADPERVADWEQITFVSKQRSPWTLSQSGIQFSPSNGMLQRGVEVLKLPDELAADLRAGSTLGNGGESSGFPWRNVLFALLGALALLVLAGLITPLRRRILVRRAPTTA